MVVLWFVLALVLLAAALVLLSLDAKQRNRRSGGGEGAGPASAPGVGPAEGPGGEGDDDEADAAERGRSTARRSCPCWASTIAPSSAGVPTARTRYPSGAPPTDSATSVPEITPTIWPTPKSEPTRPRCSSGARSAMRAARTAKGPLNPSCTSAQPATVTAGESAVKRTTCPAAPRSEPA